MTHHPHHLNAPLETLADDPPLAELLTHRLVAVTPDTGPLVAAEVMATAGARHLPVLDGDHCVGVLAEPDVLRALTTITLGPLTRLCRPAEALRPSDPRSAAAAAMHRSGLDAVLVVEHGQLPGIVTATDLVASLVPRTGEDGTSDPSAGPASNGIVEP